jgi:hypothetical protein
MKIMATIAFSRATLLLLANPHPPIVRSTATAKRPDDINVGGRPLPLDAELADEYCAYCAGIESKLDGVGAIDTDSKEENDTVASDEIDSNSLLKRLERQASVSIRTGGSSY